MSGPATGILPGPRLPLEVLSADPTVTAAGGRQGTLGYYAGTFYIHLTSAVDTSWVNLTPDTFTAAVAAGVQIVAGPSGAPPAGLRAFEIVDNAVDPNAPLIERPQGSTLVRRDGGNAWIYAGGAWHSLPMLGMTIFTDYGNLHALSGAFDAIMRAASRFVVVGEDPTQHPPETNYEVGTVAFADDGEAGGWFLKVFSTNVASGSAVRGSWIDLGTLGTLVNDLSHNGDPAYPGGTMWRLFDRECRRDVCKVATVRITAAQIAAGRTSATSAVIALPELWPDCPAYADGWTWVSAELSNPDQWTGPGLATAGVSLGTADVGGSQLFCYNFNAAGVHQKSTYGTGDPPVLGVPSLWVSLTGGTTFGDLTGGSVRVTLFYR
jgi:hypothetical protein